MNIESVKERIASLEAAGELTIKERIYLYSMKEHIALKEQNAALAAENYDLKHPGTYLPSKRDTPATDAAIASLRAEVITDFIAWAKEKVEFFATQNIDADVYRYAQTAARLFSDKLRRQSAPSPEASPEAAAIARQFAQLNNGGSL